MNTNAILFVAIALIVGLGMLLAAVVATVAIATRTDGRNAKRPVCVQDRSAEGDS